MIYQYHQLDGVPKNSYFLAEVKQFADFETPQIEEILFHSPNEEELKVFCKTNNWDLEGPWAIYYIGQKL